MRRRRKRWPTSWATTTTRSWPTRRGCRKERDRRAGISTPRTRSAGWSRSSADLDNTVQVSWLLEMCREFFGFQDDRITPQNWERLYDDAAEEDGRARLGGPVPQAQQARSGLPDERLRRPAHRVRHATATSRACGPTIWSSTSTSRPCASGWRRRPASKSAMPQVAREGDSASCSSTSPSTGRRRCAISLPPGFNRRLRRGRSAPSTWTSRWSSRECPELAAMEEQFADSRRPRLENYRTRCRCSGRCRRVTAARSSSSRST